MDLLSHQTDLEEERLTRKRDLAAAFRVLAWHDADEARAGHISVADPEHHDRTWLNPYGRAFGMMRVSDLICLDGSGAVVAGEGRPNGAAIGIHIPIHQRHRQTVCVVHAHGIYTKAWSALARPLAPYNQEVCAFFERQAITDQPVVGDIGLADGEYLADALGQRPLLFMRNHGAVTTGRTVGEALWWFILAERSCRIQLQLDAVGGAIPIDDAIARRVRDQYDAELDADHAAGTTEFDPYLELAMHREPDLLD